MTIEQIKESLQNPEIEHKIEHCQLALDLQKEVGSFLDAEFVAYFIADVTKGIKQPEDSYLIHFACHLMISCWILGYNAKCKEIDVEELERTFKE